jgi:hypothetical protein
MMRSHLPVSLTDHQLAAVMQAARSLPDDGGKRSCFLERVAGALARPDAKHYRHPSNQDVQDAVAQALAGLVARRVA